MNNFNLNIPAKIRVGYRDREDTYTKRLGFVTYFDLKNNLRQQQSFENWRDKEINTTDYENIPTEGFVLNEGVGGISYSRWNSRREKVRVYDPRGFEFEISVDNLLFILSYCDCIKGKGLEGEFIYAWDSNHLVLLPINSPEYQESKVYNTLVSTTKILSKDLIPGYTYLFKGRDPKKLIYAGRLLKYDHFDLYRSKSKTFVQKVYLFYRTYELEGETRYTYFYFPEVRNKLLKIVSEEIAVDYTKVLETYFTSNIGNKALSISVIKHKKKAQYEYIIRQEGDGIFFISFNRSVLSYKVYIDELGCVRIEKTSDYKAFIEYFISSNQKECLCVEFEGGIKYVDTGLLSFEKLEETTYES